ncbi:MAG: hypothetical protein ISP86_00995 [Shewanellaceae bacterium]|nr:hypothetical protein [Shewanellaceae bacterium]
MNDNRGHILWMVLLALVISSVMALQMMRIAQHNDEQFAVQVAAVRAELVAKSYIDRTLVEFKSRERKCATENRQPLSIKQHVSNKHIFYRYSCDIELSACRQGKLAQQRAVRVWVATKCGLRSCQNTGCLRATSSKSTYLTLNKEIK